MDNNSTIEGQPAAPAGALDTVISASAVGSGSVEPKLELPKVATLDVAGSSTSPRLDPLRIDAFGSQAIHPAPAPGEAATIAVPAAAIDAIPRARSNRFNPLAAGVALAAAFGVLAGALGVSVLARPAADITGATPAAAPLDIRAVQTAIEQMRTEMAALRTGVEAGTRSANAQFGKVGERFDRVERTQTDRAAKLNKAVEAIERLERRADVAPAKEVTGTVTPPPVAAAAVAAAPAHPPQPPTVPGWTLRDVYRGVALIQGARMGTIEVEAGDTVPYLGRIEAIRRQDGHWVVVTSKGVIASAR
jgi:hypothetical protein